MSRKFKLFLLIVVIFLLVLFSIVNAQAITINLFFTTIRIPLVVLVLGCFVVSFLVAMMLLLSTIMKKNRLLNRQSKQVEQLLADSNANFSEDAQAKINELEQTTHRQSREISDLRHKLASYILEEADENQTN
ncbi:hypothetical protein CBF34_08055 [Vagococcus penaei]|uniref:Uncharacterized protein n=1 Tax=Vagococcus penaei TaxID=633807 RepID=A0A1Q2D584_9ENTE|nr:LapA family protein [Vagococcus penaei]AQP53445.1 hypothetical protein BW732_03790 [Vagococcus penaei]RSU00834.1 hypothetical protein CBF34_08055 [Vagococcus penaei]